MSLPFEVDVRVTLRAYDQADAEHLAALYVDRIRGLAPNDVDLLQVKPWQEPKPDVCPCQGDCIMDRSGHPDEQALCPDWPGR